MKNFSNAIVCQLFIVSCFTGICLAVDSRPLDEGEKARLYSAWERNQSRKTLPIDVTFSKKTINSPSFTESRRKQRQQKNEEWKKNPKTSQRTRKSAGFLSPKQEEFFLYQLRLRINGFSKYRADVIVFGHEKKETESYNAAHINNNGMNSKIDNKRKLASINGKYKWGASRDVLTYGTFLGHREIVKDIIFLCRKKKANITPTVKSTTREFRHKGVVKIAGRDAVVIELFDLKNNYTSYEMFLDVDDWGQCYKFISYNEDGICAKKISEFSKFLKDKESGILYPRLIVKRYFFEDCKEKQRDIIKIQEVNLKALLKDSIFEVNVTDDYSVLDHRVDPVLRIPPKAEGKTE